MVLLITYDDQRKWQPYKASKSFRSLQDHYIAWRATIVAKCGLGVSHLNESTNCQSISLFVSLICRRQRWRAAGRQHSNGYTTTAYCSFVARKICCKSNMWIGAHIGTINISDSWWNAFAAKPTAWIRFRAWSTTRIIIRTSHPFTSFLRAHVSMFHAFTNRRWTLTNST